VLAELSVPYVDAAAGALSWAPTPPATPALHTLVLRRDEARLSLALLAASHSAGLRVADDEVTETVACPGAGEPLPATRDRLLGCFHYRFRSSVERLGPGRLSLLAARLRDGSRGSGNRLAGVFPGDADAVTALCGALSPGAAGWRTWHLYPNTGEAVRTSTTVRW